MISVSPCSTRELELIFLLNERSMMQNDNPDLDYQIENEVKQYFENDLSNTNNDYPSEVQHCLREIFLSGKITNDVNSYRNTFRSIYSSYNIIGKYIHAKNSKNVLNFVLRYTEIINSYDKNIVNMCRELRKKFNI